MPDAVAVYHALPYPAKVAAASLWGAYLSSIRYGWDTDADVEAALARESWSPDQWRAWQEDQLARVLHHAAKHVEYYREQWAERRRHGDRSSVEHIKNWPVLHKEDIRSSPDAFIADNYSKRFLVRDHTSGSSGVPLSLWIDIQGLRAWYALFEARWRRWYGLSRHDRWGMLGGKLIAPFTRSQPPYWVWNAGMHQLYLSTFHISPKFVPAYVESMRRHKLVYLLGYASSLYDVARFVVDQGLEPPTLRAVLSNAEALYPHQRETITAAFGCRVFDTYGQAEFVCASSECLAGHMHMWPEVGVAEVLCDDSDEPVPAGMAGRLVSTGLLNHAMPLVRYEIGDRVSFANSEAPCSCGCRLPTMGRVEGRTEDVIITPDGRCVEPDTVFQSDLRIHEAQIIQETAELIRICIVPAAGYNKKTAETLISRMKDRVGNMAIVVDEVPDIPRTQAGKRKVIVSKLKGPPLGTKIDA